MHMQRTITVVLGCMVAVMVTAQVDRIVDVVAELETGVGS